MAPPARATVARRSARCWDSAWASSRARLARSSAVSVWRRRRAIQATASPTSTHTGRAKSAELSASALRSATSSGTR